MSVPGNGWARFYHPLPFIAVTQRTWLHIPALCVKCAGGADFATRAKHPLGSVRAVSPTTGLPFAR